MFKSLDEYKAAYSKFVDSLVDLHNYHQVFMVHKGYRPSNAVRKALREMRILSTQLAKKSKQVERDYNIYKKELREKKRKEKEWRKANPKKRKDQKEKNNHDKHN
jgi:hypothetical protein